MPTRQLTGERLRGERLRVAAAFAALAAGLTALVLAVTLVQALPHIASSASPRAPGAVSNQVPTTPSGSAARVPGPPAGAVVLGANAGRDAVGLAVVPGRRLLVQVWVVDDSGNGVDRLPVKIDVRGRGGRGATVSGRSCGSGCYRAFAKLAAPRDVVVWLGHHRTSFELPMAWPPPSAAGLIARATHVYRSLRTFVVHDKLGDGREAVTTVFRIVAPDSLSYDVRGGGRSIIIGSRRWDLAEGSKTWTEQPQVPITQPTPFWIDAIDARLLGTVRVGGRAAWKVSFYDPATPAWFTLLIDKRNLHTLEMRMTAHAHFMHDTYGAFDAPLRILPPPAGTASR